MFDFHTTLMARQSEIESRGHDTGLGMKIHHVQLRNFQFWGKLAEKAVNGLEHESETYDLMAGTHATCAT